jgi:hypothetical protein
MSMCLSLMTKWGTWAIIRRIVYLLSHLMTISWPKLSYITLNSYFHYKTSLVAWDKVNNSASVLEVVTVFCLVDRQFIRPPNNWNRHSSVLYLVIRSSAKAASLTQLNICGVSDAENSIIKEWVSFK